MLLRHALKLTRCLRNNIKRYVEKDLPAYERKLKDIKRRQTELKESIVSEEKFLKLMKVSLVISVIYKT